MTGCSTFVLMIKVWKCRPGSGLPPLYMGYAASGLLSAWLDLLELDSEGWWTGINKNLDYLAYLKCLV